MLKGTSKLDDRDADVVMAIKTSASYTAASKALNVKRGTLVTYLQRNPQHSIAHFRWASNRPLSDEIVFAPCETPRYHVVKRRVLERGLLVNVCVECGQEATWNGKELVLELNHKDGDPCNNTIFNLEMLCPNCHSQTPTSKGRNSKGVRKRLV